MWGYSFAWIWIKEKKSPNRREHCNEEGAFSHPTRGENRYHTLIQTKRPRNVMYLTSLWCNRKSFFSFTWSAHTHERAYGPRTRTAQSPWPLSRWRRYSTNPPTLSAMRYRCCRRVGIARDWTPSPITNEERTDTTLSSRPTGQEMN